MSELTAEVILDVVIKPRKKAGQPTKITKKNVEKIAKLLAHGLTEAEAAEVLGLDRITIYRAKLQREFCNTVLEAKDTADREVVKSLYLSAVGFNHPEEKVFCHEGKIIVHKTTKQYPPNVGAATLWLINRKREDWRKEIQKEENRPGTQPPMIRLISRVNGKEAAQIRATGNQINVLLGDDYVADVKASTGQRTEVDGNA